MAVCDAHYIFTVVNIGDYGSSNDSSVLENSPMGKAFATRCFGVPDEEQIEGCTIPIPYFLVGDDIFGLKTWLMRSHPGKRNLSEDQKVYNYRF